MYEWGSENKNMHGGVKKPSGPTPILLNGKALTLPMCISFSHVHLYCFFFLIQRMYSLGGLARNDQGFEHSICASRGHASSKRH